jgi:hypothetical protein
MEAEKTSNNQRRTAVEVLKYLTSHYTTEP